jgi:glucokinase-like ROK family protein
MVQRKQTADQSTVRRHNTVIVLDVVRRFSPLSRAEIAARTGLNRSTVSSIVQSLLNRRFLIETDYQEDRIGRPGLSLTLNPQGGFAVGLEINVDSISAVLVDLTAHIVDRVEIEVQPNWSQADMLREAAQLVDKMLHQGQHISEHPLGIGIGLPGIVDTNSGVLVFAPNLGWRDVNIQEYFKEKFYIPVYVENEANCGAYGEYRFGAARDTNSFLFLSGGVGLGGGVMIDGALYRGSQGYAGEFGHMVIDRGGALCNCGRRGCWETAVGPRAVLDNVQTRIQSGAVSALSEMVNNNLAALKFSHVVQAAQQNDIVTLEALQQVGLALGAGLTNLVNVFNPALVVLGGALSLLHEHLLPVAMQVVQSEKVVKQANQLRIIASSQGKDASLMGAAALVLDNVLQSPFD